MQTVSSTVKQIMLQEPYYGLFACSLNKQFKPVGTAGVGLDGINYILYIDEDFWKKLTPNYRYAVLKHELLHICFFHVTDSKSFETFCPDRNMLNIAMDLEVESNINESYWLKDENGKYIGTADTLFSTMPDLKKSMGTRYYINYLKQLKDLSNGQKPGQGENSKGQTGQNENEPNPSQTEQDWNKLSKSDKDKVSNILNQENDLHKTWSEAFKDLTDEQRELVKQQAEFQIKEIAKSIKDRGLIPGELQSLIARLLKPKPPIFNWKGYFRRLLGINFDIYQKKTRRKESNRFEDCPGLQLRKKHKILVAIDTSGSVNDKEFEDFFSEILHIYKAGADIHILECDARITNEYDYKGVMPTKITGRGGTSFLPPVNYYNEHRGDYTACVYFTDGYGDQEQCNPLGKMIWVITSDGDQDERYGKFPGVKVCIPKQNNN